MNQELKEGSVGTLLSQGAAGGALGIFLLTVCAILYIPNGYNFLLMVYLPVLVAIGLVIGTVAGMVIWLSEAILKRSLGFLARSLVAVIFASLIATSYILTKEGILDWWSFLSWSLVVGGFLGLPTGLIVGSGVRPWSILIFGSGNAPSLTNFSSWLSFPAGLLLRIGSLVGLLEALLLLACLVSNALAGWGSFANNQNREALIDTIVAVLYFSASALASLTHPRKIILLTTAVIANAPLALWTLNQNGPADGGSRFLAIVAWIFISLWIVLVVGRLIAPDTRRGAQNGRSGNAELMAGET